MSHWYTLNGEPAHFQENGRGTTLREARKDNLVPSVTEISNILAAPGLTQWILNQHLDVAWLTNNLVSPHVIEEIEEQKDKERWISEVKKEASDRMSKARDFGTAVHDALEKAYKAEEMVEGFEEYVEAVDKAIKERYGLQAWDSERSFAHPFGFGGMVDLSCRGYVVDFKTKDTPWKTKKDGTPTGLVWDNHRMQLAAYRKGLGYENAKCANVFICNREGVEVYIYEHTEEDLERGWKMFELCLKLWQLSKNYYPE